MSADQFKRTLPLFFGAESPPHSILISKISIKMKTVKLLGKPMVNAEFNTSTYQILADGRKFWVDASLVTNVSKDGTTGTIPSDLKVTPKISSKTGGVYLILRPETSFQLDEVSKFVFTAQTQKGVAAALQSAVPQ